MNLVEKRIVKSCITPETKRKFLSRIMEREKLFHQCTILNNLTPAIEDDALVIELNITSFYQETSDTRNLQLGLAMKTHQRPGSQRGAISLIKYSGGKRV